MTIPDKLRDVILHPLTAGTVVLSALASTLGPLAPLWDFLGATAGTWFPIVAVSAGTILPNIGYGKLGTLLLVSAGVLYVAIYTDRFIDRIQERFL